MKRLVMLGLMALMAVTLIIGTISAQPGGPGQGGGRYCPWMGGGQGPGRQGGQGGWCCPWMGSQPGSPPVAKPGQPLTGDQARALVEQSISGNPNLKVGQVAEKNGAYEVEVVTQNGSLVDKIQVNKQTGWFRSAY